MHGQRSIDGWERALDWRPHRSHREDFSLEEKSKDLIREERYAKEKGPWLLRQSEVKITKSCRRRNGWPREMSC
jgi:hypothetical protein